MKKIKMYECVCIVLFFIVVYFIISFLQNCLKKLKISHLFIFLLVFRYVFLSLLAKISANVELFFKKAPNPNFEIPSLERELFTLHYKFIFFPYKFNSFPLQIFYNFC